MGESILKFFRDSPILTLIMLIAIFLILFGWQSVIYLAAVEVLHFIYFIILSSGPSDDDDWFDPRGPRQA